MFWNAHLCILLRLACLFLTQYISYNDMGSPDYREQFNHALAILEAAKVGYVHVMDGLGFGFHQLGAYDMRLFRKLILAVHLLSLCE